MKKTIKIMLLAAAFGMTLQTGKEAQAASYVDQSIYTMNTSKVFTTEAEVKKAVETLKKDKKWTATYQTSGNTSTYQLTASGYESQAAANASAAALKKEVGMSGTVSPVGDRLPLQKVVSDPVNDESQAKKLSLELTKTSGLNSSYEVINQSKPSYQVISGTIDSETKVKNIQTELQKQAGVTSTYQTETKAGTVYQLISSGIVGQSKANTILQGFQKTSGLKPVLQTLTAGKPYYIVTSAAQANQSKAQTLLTQLQKEAKISGKIQKTGALKNVYSLESGYFKDNKQAASAAAQMKKQTGAAGAVQRVGKTKNYIVKLNQLNDTAYAKTVAFFKKKKWRYTSKKISSTQPYQVVTGNLLGDEEAKKAAAFFQKKKVSATTKKTGKVSDSTYRLVVNQAVDQAKVNKGAAYLKTQKLTSSIKASNGQAVSKTYRLKTTPVYEQSKVKQAQEIIKKNGVASSTKTLTEAVKQYRITTEPTVNQTKLNQALSYLTKQKMKAAAQKTGAADYAQYQIKTGVISTAALRDQGLAFFKKRNETAAYTTTTKPTYKINITQQFTGLPAVNEAIAFVKSQYGWTATAVKIKNGPMVMQTNYNLTVNEMVNKQMKVSPQTDGAAYVYAAYVDQATSTVNTDGLNVRSTPDSSSASNIVAQLNKGAKVKQLGKEGNWIRINLGWRNASAAEVQKYVDPANIAEGTQSYFQFLKLSEAANLNPAEVNSKVLAGKGILAGKGQAFITAAKTYHINEIYLISHALLETGNGNSILANGTMYNGKKVYNMYGIGAYDSNPNYLGAKYAYEQQWFTPEAAIIGGAKFIGNSYINNATYKQDTIYKMRWSAAATHQYATDIGWASKQVTRMYSLYNLLDDYTLYYDIPVYNK
ncbi:N-acetylglucosaminidase [Bacillus safensis]|uniref:N-acetylglucosaminidase n=1 Tax=Bacillus safensis TaxID=561879 RepID=UPI000B4436D3|nr:N-acetylglucosaminidase [Bacillus safensis]MCY7492437.1 N-acetylglucosaminidase [Bacillus safensis]MED4993454.1 N-acetylglucosaminidase [Bacillus safensis]UDB49299.1 N-acetylglucosaminidase [Bacillus safensis]